MGLFMFRPKLLLFMHVDMHFTFIITVRFLIKFVSNTLVIKRCQNTNFMFKQN